MSDRAQRSYAQPGGRCHTDDLHANPVLCPVAERVTVYASLIAGGSVRGFLITN